MAKLLRPLRLGVHELYGVQSFTSMDIPNNTGCVVCHRAPAVLVVMMSHACWQRH